MELEEAVTYLIKIANEYKTYGDLDSPEFEDIKKIPEAIKIVVQELKDIHTDLQEIYVDMRINGSNYYADKLNKAMKGRLHWDKR